MIDNIIQSVTEKLSSLPYIEGIVLGGSRARGTHTEDSDIDIGIYYKSESFDITAINQIATELDDENRNNLVVPPGAWGDWINGGGWLVINGYHVDLILRDIKRVEQIIKDRFVRRGRSRRGITAAFSFSTTFFEPHSGRKRGLYGFL